MGVHVAVDQPGYDGAADRVHDLGVAWPRRIVHDDIGDPPRFEDDVGTLTAWRSGRKDDAAADELPRHAGKTAGAGSAAVNQSAMTLDVTKVVSGRASKRSRMRSKWWCRWATETRCGCSPKVMMRT